MSEKNEAQGSAKNEKRGVDRLVAATHKEFKNMLEGNFVTPQTLGLVFGEFIGSQYSDYEGCTITPNIQMPGGIAVDIYFKDKPEVTGKVKSLINPLSKSTKDDTTFNKLRKMNIANSDKNYELLDGTKTALSEFMYGNGYDKETRLPRVNWKQAIAEITEPTSFGMSNIYLKVSGFDPIRLLAAIYGGYDENGKPFDYNISVVSGLLNVQRIKREIISELLAQVGFANTAGQIPMIRY